MTYNNVVAYIQNSQISKWVKYLRLKIYYLVMGNLFLIFVVLFMFILFVRYIEKYSVIHGYSLIHTHIFVIILTMAISPPSSSSSLWSSKKLSIIFLYNLRFIFLSSESKKRSTENRPKWVLYTTLTSLIRNNRQFQRSSTNDTNALCWVEILQSKKSVLINKIANLTTKRRFSSKQKKEIKLKNNIISKIF